MLLKAATPDIFAPRFLFFLGVPHGFGPVACPLHGPDYAAAGLKEGVRRDGKVAGVCTTEGGLAGRWACFFYIIHTKYNSSSSTSTSIPYRTSMRRYLLPRALSCYIYFTFLSESNRLPCTRVTFTHDIDTSAASTHIPVYLLYVEARQDG